MMEMEPHQESTYEPLEGQPLPRNRLESTDSPDVETSQPQDRNGILYIALVAAGIGFVLPYNRSVCHYDTLNQSICFLLFFFFFQKKIFS